MSAHTATGSGSTHDEAPAVVIQGVAKHFGEVEALRGLSAVIRYGRLTGLCGPDRAGKTTAVSKRLLHDQRLDLERMARSEVA